MKNKKWLKYTILGVVVALILVADLVSKYIASQKLGTESVTIIPHLIDFKFTTNRGAAWGIMEGRQAFLIFLAVLFVAVFVWYYIKEKHKTWLLTISVGLLMAGCLGNMIDRIFLGYVRDFIMFDFWKSFPIFNFADIALCVGVALFIIYLIVYFVKTEKVKKEEKTDNNDGENA